MPGLATDSTNPHFRQSRPPSFVWGPPATGRPPRWAYQRRDAGSGTLQGQRERRQSRRARWTSRPQRERRQSRRTRWTSRPQRERRQSRRTRWASSPQRERRQSRRTRWTSSPQRAEYCSPLLSHLFTEWHMPFHRKALENQWGGRCPFGDAGNFGTKPPDPRNHIEDPKSCSECRKLWNILNF
jgi:hypothetical protein